MYQSYPNYYSMYPYFKISYYVYQTFIPLLLNVSDLLLPVNWWSGVGYDDVADNVASYMVTTLAKSICYPVKRLSDIYNNNGIESLVHTIGLTKIW